MTTHDFTYDPDETANRLERHITRGRIRLIEDAIRVLERVLEDEDVSDLGWTAVKDLERAAIEGAQSALAAVKHRLR